MYTHCEDWGYKIFPPLSNSEALFELENHRPIKKGAFGVPTRLSFMGWSARGECGFSGAHDACVLKNSLFAGNKFLHVWVFSVRSMDVNRRLAALLSQG